MLMHEATCYSRRYQRYVDRHEIPTFLAGFPGWLFWQIFRIDIVDARMTPGQGILASGIDRCVTR